MNHKKELLRAHGWCKKKEQSLSPVPGGSGLGFDRFFAGIHRGFFWASIVGFRAEGLGFRVLCKSTVS